MVLILLACAAPSGGSKAPGSVDTGSSDTGTRDTEADSGADTVDDTIDTAVDDSGADTGDDDATGNLSLSAEAWWAGESADLGLTSGRFVGDLDLDGTDDVVLLGTHAREPDLLSAVWYVPGGQPVGPEMTAAGTATAQWYDGYPAWPTLAIRAGDVDGDGWPDLWFGRSGEMTWTNLALGPPARWSVESPIATDATVDAGGAQGATDLDLDGDGLADAAWFTYDDATGVGGGVSLVHGADASEIGVGERIWCDAPYRFAAGDVTGDGTTDYLVSFADDVRLLDGADVPAGASAQGEDLFGTVVTGEVGHPLAVVGDWTGDGIDDWANAASNAGDAYHEGVVTVFAGGATATAAGEVDAATVAAGSFSGGYERASLGLGDLATVRRSEGEAAYLVTAIVLEDDVAAILLPPGLGGAHAALPGDTIRLTGTEGERVGQGVTSLGDFDGDGTLDLLAGSSRWEDGRGRIFLDLGW